MRTPSLTAMALATLVVAGLGPPLKRPVSAPAGLPVSVPAVSVGSLSVSTEPGTAILWDGNPLGTTDDSGRMTISNIPLGSYSITLRNESFEELVRALNIDSGTQSLEVSLSKRPASAPAVPPVSAPADSLEDESETSAPTIDATLPDPFAKQSTSLVSVAVTAFLIAIALGALWLGRRRGKEIEEPILPTPEGPRVVMAEEPRGRRRAPGFYEDLRHRETVLENLKERGPDRPRPKIIELPVADPRFQERDR